MIDDRGIVERHEMEIFLALSEELHFGRTADRLHVSGALVSQTVKKLERRLGASLFERTSRRVSLTKMGEQLRDDLQPHYQGIQQAVDKIVSASNGRAGHLRVGFEGVAAGSIAHEAASILQTRHPGFAVYVRETTHGQRWSQLRDDEADLLISAMPVREPDLTVGPVVAREQMYLAVSPRHRLAAQESVCLEDLAGETYAAGVEGIPDYWLDYFCPRQTPSGKPIGRSTDRFGTYHESLAMVATGKVLTVGDAQVLKYYQRPDIAYIPFTDAPPIEHALVWRTGSETAMLRALVDAICEVAEPRMARS